MSSSENLREQFSLPQYRFGFSYDGLPTELTDAPRHYLPQYVKQDPSERNSKETKTSRHDAFQKSDLSNFFDIRFNPLYYQTQPDLHSSIFKNYTNGNTTGDELNSTLQEIFCATDAETKSSATALSERFNDSKNRK